jgi:hypothetical protein
MIHTSRPSAVLCRQFSIFGIPLLGYKKAFDELRFTCAQVPLTRAATIAIGAYAHPAAVDSIGAQFC